MKNLIRLGIASSLISLIIVQSCKKTTDTVSDDLTQLNKKFAAIRTTPQTLSVTAGRDTVVFGKDSTMLHFYTNSFKDAAGNIITSGTVNLQLIEMYQPGDMVANRATTTSNGKLLQSSGQVKITAWWNNQAITANKYGIGFKQAVPSAVTMSLFYGDTNNPDSVTTWGEPATGPGTSANAVLDTSTRLLPGYRYMFDSCSTFNWVNCDKFYNNPSGNTTIKMKTGDSRFTETNTQIVLVFPSKNCVTSGGHNFDAGSKTFTLGNHGTYMPLSVNYILVAIANINGTFYYCEVRGTTTQDMIVTAAMAPETLYDIKARLSGLH